MSRITKTVLDNGIKVITEEMPESESSCVGFWVRTGSRYEGEGTSGISHLIEHMLFKGTRKRTAFDISREIESVGGVLNAFTSREYTCFYAKVLNKDIPRAVDILADIFMNSVFSAAELEKEKMVILQEIKMVEDTPDDLIHDLFAEKCWRGHPLGRSILGTNETVSAFKRSLVARHFAQNYLPRRVLVTAAGGVRHGAVLKLIKDTLGRLGEAGSIETGPVPEATPGVFLLERGNLEQVHLCMGVPVPPQPHPDLYKVYLLHTVLGAGMSSRLFQKIREKRGLVYSVYSYLSLYMDAGTLVVYAGTSDENFPKVVDLVIKEFRLLRKDGVKRSELEDAKSQLKGSLLLGLESSENRMTKLARDEIYFGGAVSVSRIKREIEGVRVPDLRELAGDCLAEDKITLVAMGRVTGKGLPGLPVH